MPGTLVDDGGLGRQLRGIAAQLGLPQGQFKISLSHGHLMWLEASDLARWTTDGRLPGVPRWVADPAAVARLLDQQLERRLHLEIGDFGYVEVVVRDSDPTQWLVVRQERP